MHISTSKQDATQWVKCVYHARIPRSLPNNFGSPVVVKRYMQQTNWFKISAVLQVPMLIVFWRCLGKNVVIMSKASPQVSQNSMQMEATKRTFPTWKKSTTNWTLLGNLWPTLGQSATDFGDITDFEEIRHRLWGNPSPTLVKSATDFVKLRFQDNFFLGKNLVSLKRKPTGGELEG